MFLQLIVNRVLLHLLVFVELFNFLDELQFLLVEVFALLADDLRFDLINFGQNNLRCLLFNDRFQAWLLLISHAEVLSVLTLIRGLAVSPFLL